MNRLILSNVHSNKPPSVRSPSQWLLIILSKAELYLIKGLYLRLMMHSQKMSLLLSLFRNRNAFSVETSITSDTVTLLAVLSAMIAAKRHTSPRFVSRRLLARKARTSRLHFCLSITSLPRSDPRLVYNLLLWTLNYKDCGIGQISLKL